LGFGGRSPLGFLNHQDALSPKGAFFFIQLGDMQGVIPSRPPVLFARRVLHFKTISIAAGYGGRSPQGHYNRPFLFSLLFK